jgi:hypothetical protein
VYKEEIQRLTQKVEQIKNQFDELNGDDIGNDKYEALQAEVYEIGDEIDKYIDFIGSIEGEHYNQLRLRTLQKTIAQIKEENDFYDPKGELDIMRHEDDADEDSISSYFGEE